MAPHYDVDDDWSDSDEETGCDVETSVQLGVPDGPLDSAEDRLDAAVSRIGGHPAFLTSPEPPIESALCKNCSTPMELLVQVWCPMEESPCDRALYVWGCSRGVCQKLEGSVRAWRGLKFNEKYAAKLQNRKEKQRQKELARVKADEEEAKRKSSMKTNPFSMGATPSALNSFGLGTAIFGQCEPKELNEEIEGELDKIIGEGDDAAEDSESSEQDEAEDGLLVTAMAATTLESSPWASAPAYDVLYLSTIAEYLPPAPKPKLSISKEDEVNGDNMEGGSKVKDTTWGLEGYENSLDIDHAFERFSKRVGYEGEQCLRYELCGTPLPFGSDKVFDLLFPPPPKPNLPVTKPDSMVVPPVKRTYDPSSVPMCPHCQGKRVFECQLMPNLINVLKRVNESQGKEKTKQTDEERRKEVGKQLNSTADIDRVGMEWGTCFVFSCERDCCIEAGSDVKNCWREEVVFVQWDV
ncbi:programmed cell death protein 2 [Irpex rosettiformis]|uniref:Programmed cell death protein 2 n=1 Tax=Irpex rosettiformis TaxID=378272 RepID=A0ACB8UBM3_9APHY|nr:programmed cell death protein 2 [Irpex rosettiformis]